MKSQLTLEALLVLAALVAFIAVLLPAYGKAQTAVFDKALDNSQEQAFETILSTARQAQAFGRNSVINARIYLAANSTFSYENKTLKMRYGNKTITEKTSFPISITSDLYERGNYGVKAEMQDEVLLTLERQE